MFNVFAMSCKQRFRPHCWSMLLLTKSFCHSALRHITHLSYSTVQKNFGDSKRAAKELPGQHNQQDIYVPGNSMGRRQMLHIHLLWPWSLTFWLQNLTSICTSPNTRVTTNGWNSLHWFLRYGIHKVFGRHTDGHTQKHNAFIIKEFRCWKHNNCYSGYINMWSNWYMANYMFNGMSKPQ